MIKQIILECLGNSLLISILVVLLFFLLPIMKKHISTLCLYAFCIVLLLGYLIPFRPLATQSLFTLPIQSHSTTERQYDQVLMPVSDGNSSSLSDFSTDKVDVRNTHKVQQPVESHLLAIKQFVKTHYIIILFVVWLTGFVFTFVYRLAKNRNQRNTILRLSKPIEEQSILNQLAAMQCQLHIKCKISLRTSHIVGSPVTLGCIQPTILLPTCDYSDEERALLLHHELVHIKRHDLLLQWCLLLCLSIHWFNPIVYLFVTMWRILCEDSCDSIVLQKANSQTRIQYGYLLLKTAHNQNKVSQLLILAFCGGKNKMKKRLETILDSKKKKSGILSLCLLIVFLCSTTIFSFAKDTDSYTKQATEEELLQPTDDSETPDNTADSSEADSKTNDIKVDSSDTDSKTNDIKVDSSDADSKTNDNKVDSSDADSKTKDIKVDSSEKDTLNTADKNQKNNETNIDRDAFATNVLTYVGAPYCYGGASLDSGFDCSGFVQYLYSGLGYSVPRSTIEQSEYATPIQESELLPGDLVFYGSKNKINHVAIYTGDNKVVHASNPRDGVKISDINYRVCYGYGRIIN